MTEVGSETTGKKPVSDENLGIMDVSGITGGIQSPFAPPNPKMSEFYETAPGSGSWYARSGGPPKSDWSGIDESRPRAKKSTLQMRSSNPAHEQKTHATRVEGLPVKLDMDGNLPEFYESATRRLQSTGLDTIAYARDPLYPTEKPTVMVIKHHARYTANLEHNIEQINKFAEDNYDDFDQLNDNAAQEFLFNSVSDQLRTDLQLVVEHSDCFVSVYLRLMDLVVSVSSAHHDKLRESIRLKLPKQYPGEDVKSLCEFYKESADELHRASQFNPTLILDMLQNLSTVSVSGSFPFDILSKHREVKECLDSNAGLPSDEIEKILLRKKLNYGNVLKFATKSYNDLLKDGKWPPAKAPTDSGNRALAALNMVSNPETFADSVLALIQTKMGGNFSPKKGKPGKADHIAKDIPDKFKSTNSDTGDKKKNWKRIAPKEGEVQTKKVGKRTFYWCAKCNRWSTTHKTATHVIKGDAKSPDAHAPATNLMFEHGAWCMYEGDDLSTVVPESDGYSFSMNFTLGYLVVTYFFMVFYLVRNDIFRLSTIFNNVGIFSLCQSILTFINTFGGIDAVSTSLMSAISPALSWVGPFGAPLLWFVLGVSAFRMSVHESITTVDVIDSRMKRGDRRAYERHVKKSLKSQLREFRPTPLRSFRVHGKYIRRHWQKAPTVSFRRQKATYDRIYDSCQDTVSACSHRHRHSTKNRRDHRWNKLFRTHLDGISIRQPCNKHLQKMKKNDKFFSCFNACSSSQSKTNKEWTFPVVWNSGASVCITHDRKDFIQFSPKSNLQQLNSVGGGHAVNGEGLVLWSVIDSKGMLRHLKVKAYYVPSSKVRLLSLHALLQHYEDETIDFKPDHLTLSGSSSGQSRNAIRVTFHPVSRLPISTAYRYNGVATDFTQPIQNASAYAMSSVVSSTNSNLSEAEKELLRWHFKLGHISFTKVQHLMHSGILSHTEGTRRLHTAAASLRHAPKCAACTFAKQRVRSSPGRKITTIQPSKMWLVN